jgi:hypothetical protein
VHSSHFGKIPRSVTSRFGVDQQSRSVTPKATLAWAHDTGADPAKTTVNGGAIAIGHQGGGMAAKALDDQSRARAMVGEIEQLQRAV